MAVGGRSGAYWLLRPPVPLADVRNISDGFGADDSYNVDQAPIQHSLSRPPGLRGPLHRAQSVRAAISPHFLRAASHARTNFV